VTHDLAVDPLERTCTELVFTDARQSQDEEQRGETLVARELVNIPVFVLLGEPGMGKSKVMRALADYGIGEFITVNDFIVHNAIVRDGSRTLFIDALDEARSTGDTTVWKELRQGIARSSVDRFGVACRAADWNPTDRDDLKNVAKGQAIRVFSLDPLTPEERRSVLRDKGIGDVETFEDRAQALGFDDMLGNPQSLELLVAAIKNRGNQWPDNRMEAYELACKELVKEVNPRHQQVLRRSAPANHEELLDAAGWLCAILLLGNSHQVFEGEGASNTEGSVALLNVLDALPAVGPSRESVVQVLQRRLFVKPNGYAPVHRTVAEYLAARHLTKRINGGGLLPMRVASLMLATPLHLVSNLRGLAGWLAALCEPMQSAIFDADPAAVLNYGDLHLLPTATKQALIRCLATHPNVRYESHPWQRAASHVPLVQEDMQSFVTGWLSELLHTEEPATAKVFTTHVLLSALAHAPRDAGWESTLLHLLRDERSPADIRDSALHALFRHNTSHETLIGLLDEIALGAFPDERGRLSDRLLESLYPTHVRPSQVLRYLSPIRSRRRGIPGFGVFWAYDIQKQTLTAQLAELMEALNAAHEQGVFKSDAFAGANHGLEGLESLAVSAIETFGAALPVPQLVRWLQLFSRTEDPVFKSLRPENVQRLTEWFNSHADKVKEVLKHRVDHGASSWDAQHGMPAGWVPSGMGAFWLAQALDLQARNEAARAQECLQTAFSWLDQPDSGITLDDLVAAVQGHAELEVALQSRLVSKLDESNWQRTHWLDSRKYRELAAERTELNERNREYLLNHLDDVRSGKLLRYLSESAWLDRADAGYSGGLGSEVIKHWRETHPELDEATRQGYRALLEGLTSQQAADAITSHKKSSVWHFELPCLIAAEQLFAQSPAQFFQLGKERIQALITVYLLHHLSKTDWLLALIEEQCEWVEEVWWSLGSQALRSRKQIRIPFLWVLAREPRARALAVRMLPRFLAAWPVKFPEESFAEFAQLLEAVLKVCPQEVSDLVTQRLRKKSLSSLQRAYLVMAGLWVKPNLFHPLIRTLLSKQQLIQSEMLGFVGHMYRHGGRDEELPKWDANTAGMLFRLFGPLCRPELPEGGGWLGSKESGRELLHRLLGSLRADTSAAAQHELQQLISDPALGEWRESAESALVRQSQFRAEQSFAQPTARQVALTLQNKTPANPADLMAVCLDALDELQKAVRNSPTNLINRFWSVDFAGKRPKPPHRPEPACRDVIADELKKQLKNLGISVDPEHQHGGQNQSDIVLRVQTPDHEDMLLPIEVKGDWNVDLWTAPHQQLALRYASDPACFGQGVYLVLWLGAQRGAARFPKQHPNRPSNTPGGFQELLQREVAQKAPSLNIQIVVLDVSIH
jgi:hypothetical protein